MTAPAPTPESPSPEPTSRQRAAALRIWDASANRAGEAIRVIEDYARFALDDALLSETAKTLRHDLTAALATVPVSDRLRARETPGDVGTAITTPGEARREELSHVVRAAFARLEQALRSLEEYAKILAPAAAGLLEALRYRTYTLEPAVFIAGESRARLARMNLCVLLEGGASTAACAALAGSLLEAGVPALQLRDKQLESGELLARARALRELTTKHQALLFINDRPDIALLSQADGVHLGQDDLPLAEARRLVGPAMLIGISTHSLAQAEAAALAGADYIGMGPMFPSGTKSFEEFPGPELARQVSERTSLPALAIGGIHAENVGELLAAGASRFALAGAITRAEDPASAAREFLQRLQRAPAAIS